MLLVHVPDQKNLQTPALSRLQALEAFAGAWDSRYPQISRSWQSNWSNLATFFAWPADIRKVIYTTNAIESLNSVIRHATKKRKVFPTDDAVKKGGWRWWVKINSGPW